uniref:Uncharacterized protein n=1 Tax=Arundo donax TaxID=35708 RepID=A0A0A9AE07_ARUDO
MFLIKVYIPKHFEIPIDPHLLF